LVIKEALMIEPTETESREQMDEFIQAMLEIADLADKDPTAFATMPRTTSVSRVDETKAVRDMKFKA
jgi:glycine dehydrogenase subunit 2